MSSGIFEDNIFADSARDSVLRYSYKAKPATGKNRKIGALKLTTSPISRAIMAPILFAWALN